MENNALYKFAFLLPLGCILAVNLAMLALVIVKVRLGNTSGREICTRLFQVYNIKPRPPMLGQARGWLSLALLLGFTWALGLLGKAAVMAIGDVRSSS